MAVSKKRGIKSSAQDNFLQPNAPTIGTATNVGTSRAYNNGAISVTFTASATGPAATSFTASAYCSVHSATHTVTGASSPLVITGFGSGVVTTATVTATNAVGTSSASAASNSVTVTTIPQAPQSASATAGVNQNTINWTIGATGGAALSKHDVTGSDGTSSLNLSAAATSATIADTAGTAQTYTVTATNTNGTSLGATTASVTTLSPFFPPFFPFFPPYFPFFPGFGPFFPPSFGPFFPPSFAPFFPPFFPFFPSFNSYWSEYSIASTTGIMTKDGRKDAKDIIVGDVLIAMDLGFGLETPENGWMQWSQENLILNETNLRETTVTQITSRPTSTLYVINGDVYSIAHYILTKKDNITKFIKTEVIDDSYMVFSYENLGFVNIESLEILEYDETVYSINCEPYDNFFTENMLVFDVKEAGYITPNP